MNSNWETVLAQLERGEVRAARREENGNWVANVHVKEAILAAIRAGKNIDLAEATTGKYAGFVDKDSLLPRQFSTQDRIRFVPGGSSVRRGAYLAPGVIVMPPAYVNVGAFVDENSMVDSHVLVGSCAQIGKRVHLSAGVQIGGVLEPIGSSPVIIEDDVFVGAGAIVVEGIQVRSGAVIAPGVVLSRAVSLYDAVQGKILERGSPVPARAVVVPGSRPLKNNWATELGLQVNTPIIIKYRDDKSDAALQLENALRE